MVKAAGILNKVLVAAPFSAMVFIGAGSQIMPPEYDFVAESPSQEAAIQAYFPIVKETAKDIAGAHVAPTATLRTLAHKWLAGFHSGTYELLTPIAYDDSTRDGPKGEILRGIVSLGEELDTVQENEAAAGQYDQAISDAGLATRMAEALKYSDFSSLGVCSMVERRTVAGINDMYKHLDSAQKAKVGQVLDLMKVRTRELSDMAQLCRSQFLVYEVRRGYDKGRLTATQHYLKSNSFTGVAGIRSVTQRYGHMKMDDQDALIPDMVGSVRLGFVAAEDTDRAITEVGKTRPRSKPSFAPDALDMETL